MIRIFVQPGPASDFEIALYAVIAAAAWLAGTLLTERWAYRPAHRTAATAHGITIRRAVPQRRHVAHHQPTSSATVRLAIVHHPAAGTPFCARPNTHRTR